MTNLLNGAGMTVLPTRKKKIKQDACKIPYTKTNAKKIRDLNVKEKTLKLLEENIGRFLKDLVILKGF